MSSNELIERYVDEVGSYLPRKGRTDIQQELRSLLEDEVEERSNKLDSAEQTTITVLKEFGKPEQMAAQYQPNQYLIGPRLYPIYTRVTGIVLAVISGLLLVVLGVSFINAGDPAAQFWDWLMSYGRAMLIYLGITTLVFALVEKYGDFEIGEPSAEWDPQKLPPVNDPDRVKRGELVGEIVGSIVGIYFFLVLLSPGGLLGSFIADSFRPIIGWLVVSSAIELALNTVVLWHGRWQPMTRLLELGGEVFGLYVLYLVFSAEQILTITAISPLIKLIVSIVAVIVIFSIVVKVFQLVWKRDLSWRWQSSVAA